jgi:hypothetical protein
MSSTHYEGATSSVTGNACSYANLTNYNNGFKGMRPPVPILPGGSVPNTYSVPVYGSNGYSTLVHGSSGCCSGYPDIRSAYRSIDGSCNPKYAQSHCGM